MVTKSSRPPRKKKKKERRAQRLWNVFIRNKRGDSGLTAPGEFISLPVGGDDLWHAGMKRYDSVKQKRSCFHLALGCDCRLLAFRCNHSAAEQNGTFEKENIFFSSRRRSVRAAQGVLTSRLCRGGSETAINRHKTQSHRSRDRAAFPSHLESWCHGNAFGVSSRQMKIQSDDVKESRRSSKKWQREKVEQPMLTVDKRRKQT